MSTQLDGESCSPEYAEYLIGLEAKYCTCGVDPCMMHGLYADMTEIDPYGPDGVFGNDLALQTWKAKHGGQGPEDCLW